MMGRAAMGEPSGKIVVYGSPILILSCKVARATGNLLFGQCVQFATKGPYEREVELKLFLARESGAFAQRGSCRG